MNDSRMSCEQLSALADGHLGADELGDAIARTCGEADMRATWHAYHLIGDVLRSNDHASCSDGASFLAGFRARVAAEPAPLITAPTIVATKVRLVSRSAADAANEPVFRWKLVAGVASLAAAAAIGWNWVGTDVRVGGPQLAQQQSAQPQVNSVLAAADGGARTSLPTRIVVGNGEPQTMIRDPRLDQLLEAHQQAGGASQMPSGFLRNATFEGASR